MLGHTSVAYLTTCDSSRLRCAESASIAAGRQATVVCSLVSPASAAVGTLIRFGVVVGLGTCADGNSGGRTSAPADHDVEEPWARAEPKRVSRSAHRHLRRLDDRPHQLAMFGCVRIRASSVCGTLKQGSAPAPDNHGDRASVSAFG